MRGQWTGKPAGHFRCLTSPREDAKLPTTNYKYEKRQKELEKKKKKEQKIQQKLNKKNEPAKEKPEQPQET